MANYSDGREIDRVAGADLSDPTNLFKIVKEQADDTNPTGRSVVLSTSTSDNFFGVLNNTPKDGETAAVVGRNSHGTFKVVVGVNSTGVAIGDPLGVDTDSGAITDTTQGHQLIGYAEEAGVAGQVIEYRPTDKVHP